MREQLYKILREVGISSGSIERYMDEYRSAEEKIHKECIENQKYITNRWIEKSDAAESEFHRSLEKAELDDQLKRRGILGEYDYSEFYSWSMKNEGIRDSRIRHKTLELDKIIWILGRVIYSMGDEFEKKYMDRDYFEDRYKLVVFDVDGTLVDSSSYFPNIWHVLNKRFETEKEDDEIEKEYRDGKITYWEWADKVIALYAKKGIKRDMFLDAIESIETVEGARETLEKLKQGGKTLAVVSGSLDIVLEKVFPDNPFDYAEINRINFDKTGNITGWRATPYGDGEHKVMGLIDIAKKETKARLKRGHVDTVSLSNCVFVGDGRNDKYAIEAAGLGVLFYSLHDDLDLRNACDVEIQRKGNEKKDLRRILRYIL